MALKFKKGERVSILFQFHNSSSVKPRTVKMRLPGQLLKIDRGTAWIKTAHLGIISGKATTLKPHSLKEIRGSDDRR